jgi:membrane associated rhomboid family serine protease
MHSVDGVQNRASGGAIAWPCPGTVASDGSVANSSGTGNHTCQLSDLCGFGMSTDLNPVYPATVFHSNIADYKPAPDQWFRFIIPMFLHVGIIHIGFNMALQLTMGREMEQNIGSIRFFLVYVSSGIFGFVLGGNFAATGISSTGASGALFGVIALMALDLFYTWGERRKPWTDLFFILVDVVISFVLGLLPGLDNFSHIGGFLMGLALGICILHSPNALRKRIDQDAPPYTPVTKMDNNNADPNTGMVGFVKNPVGFFKGRKPAWWAWWLVRAGSLVAVFIVFILLLNNFYVNRQTCSWCKYLSCIVSRISILVHAIIPSA